MIDLILDHPILSVFLGYVIFAAEWAFYFFVCYVLFVLTWVFYLAVMVLKRHRHELSGPAKFFGYQALAVGYPLDILVNMVASFIFLDPPRELLFTNRLIRCLNRTDFRGRLARGFCKKMLDPFDPSGTHCGEPLI